MHTPPPAHAAARAGGSAAAPATVATSAYVTPPTSQNWISSAFTALAPQGRPPTTYVYPATPAPPAPGSYVRPPIGPAGVGTSTGTGTGSYVAPPQVMVQSSGGSHVAAPGGPYVAPPTAAPGGNSSSYVAPPPMPAATGSYVAPSALGGCFAVQQFADQATSQRPQTPGFPNFAGMPSGNWLGGNAANERQQPMVPEKVPPMTPGAHKQQGFPVDNSPPPFFDLLSATFPVLAASLQPWVSPDLWEPTSPPKGHYMPPPHNPQQNMQPRQGPPQQMPPPQARAAAPHQRSVTPERAVMEQAPPPVPVQMEPPRTKPSDQGLALRFNCGSSSRQHPRKKTTGIPNADAVEESPLMLGICDGVSGCHKLGIPPDTLPKELLRCCRDLHEQWATKMFVPEYDDGHWLLGMMKDAFDSTQALGATTMLLCALREHGQLVSANLGDCCLLVLRPVAGLKLPMRTEVLFKTAPSRYDSKRPVQVQRLPGMPDSGTHQVISGAKLNTLKVQHGDLLVLGSDGLYDNLQDEDIQRIVEKHCLMDLSLATGGAPTTGQLRDAAGALVNNAIASAQPPPKNEGNQGNHSSKIPWMKPEPSQSTANPDDTTALVAVIHQVDDPEAYDSTFDISRGRRRNFDACRTSSLQTAGAAGVRAGSQPRHGDEVLQDCTNFNGSGNPTKMPQGGAAVREGSADARFARGDTTDLRICRPPDRTQSNNNLGRRPDQDRGTTSMPSWRREPSPGERGRRMDRGPPQPHPEEAVPREPPQCGPMGPKWWGMMQAPGSANRVGSQGPPPQHMRQNNGRQAGGPGSGGRGPYGPQTERAYGSWGQNEDDQNCVIS